MSKSGVHILKCSNGRYYTGSSDDVERRIEEHQKRKIESNKEFVAGRNKSVH
jgi:predicted GIY-YIG superfamily endonuclease